MATWEQLNFQNRLSPIIEQFIFLHDHIISILILIMRIVTYRMLNSVNNSITLIAQKENHSLEVLWTFLPGVILILIAFPSLRLLYMSEESERMPITIKTIGHQWYWSYEYRDFNNIEFDCFMKPIEDINRFRLLDTDNSTVIPNKTPVQIFISSTDVLHAWTVPALGVKADSTPGRLNITNLISLKSGIYYGQCSEICGTNHSFIPIVLDVRPLENFKNWIKSNILPESWTASIF